MSWNNISLLSVIAPVAEHLWSAFGWLTAQLDSPVKLVASRFSVA